MLGADALLAFQLHGALFNLGMLQAMSGLVLLGMGVEPQSSWCVECRHCSGERGLDWQLWLPGLGPAGDFPEKGEAALRYQSGLGACRELLEDRARVPVGVGAALGEHLQPLAGAVPWKRQEQKQDDLAWKRGAIGVPRGRTGGGSETTAKDVREAQGDSPGVGGAHG